MSEGFSDLDNAILILDELNENNKKNFVIKIARPVFEAILELLKSEQKKVN